MRYTNSTALARLVRSGRDQSDLCSLKAYGDFETADGRIHVMIASMNSLGAAYTF